MTAHGMLSFGCYGSFGHFNTTEALQAGTEQRSNVAPSRPHLRLFISPLSVPLPLWPVLTSLSSVSGPSKRHQFQAVPQNPALEAGGGGGGQSANSTPNSQTPIILTGRAAPAAVGL